MRASVTAAAVGIGLALVGAALAAPAPKLRLAQVDALALRAAQFHVSPAEPYQPDPRLAVERFGPEHRGPALVWVVGVRATIPIFPCQLPVPGAPGPSCVAPPGGLSQRGVVTIVDATGRVLSLRAAI